MMMMIRTLCLWLDEAFLLGGQKRQEHATCRDQADDVVPGEVGQPVHGGTHTRHELQVLGLGDHLWWKEKASSTTVTSWLSWRVKLIEEMITAIRIGASFRS